MRKRERCGKLKDAEKSGEKILGVCPICGSEMEYGYLAVAHCVAWSDKKISNWSFKGLSSVEIIMGRRLGPFMLRIIHNTTAYRCRKCKLVIFKYGNTNES